MCFWRRSETSSPLEKFSSTLEKTEHELSQINGCDGNPFPTEGARERFIKSVLILMSKNGEDDLKGLDFQMFFNRRIDRTGKRVMGWSIVAMRGLQMELALTQHYGHHTTRSGAFEAFVVETEGTLVEFLDPAYEP